MANTAILPPMQTKKETRPNLSQIIGGTFEDIFESVTGVDRFPESHEAKEPITTPIPEYVKQAFGSGSIEFNKPQPTTEEHLMAEQRVAVTEAENILKQSKAEEVTQTEIRYEVAGMSEEERNERLHLNTSLRKEFTENVYHIAELYRQRKAELIKSEQANKATEIPSPAKQPSAMEGAFEGRSGSQGGGTANLSAQAVG